MHRRYRRGTTLLEVLIVVGIIALISAGVAVAVHRQSEKAKKTTAATQARSVRAAVKTWWLDHDTSVCPSFDELLSSGTVERGSPRTDPWNTPWQIECADHDVTVISAGPDRRPNTDDDILAPPP